MKIIKKKKFKDLKIGDIVEVKSWEEIKKTFTGNVETNGCCFVESMILSCGCAFEIKGIFNNRIKFSNEFWYEEDWVIIKTIK